MTTLLHLSQSIIDIQDALQREQRFAQDACHNLLNGTKLLREALDALERDIRAHFEERDRAVSRVMGNSQLHAPVIDTAPSIPFAADIPGGLEALSVVSTPPAKNGKKSEAA